MARAESTWASTGRSIRRRASRKDVAWLTTFSRTHSHHCVRLNRKVLVTQTVSPCNANCYFASVLSTFNAQCTTQVRRSQGQEGQLAPASTLFTTPLKCSLTCSGVSGSGRAACSRLNSVHHSPQMFIDLFRSLRVRKGSLLPPPLCQEQTASPPDVRMGSALPAIPLDCLGLRPLRPVSCISSIAFPDPRLSAFIRG